MRPAVRFGTTAARARLSRQLFGFAAKIAIAAVEIAERCAAVDATVDDAPDEHRMRAGRVVFGQDAIEMGERRVEHRRAVRRTMPREVLEATVGVAAAREALGHGLLRQRQYVDAKDAGLRNE